MEAVWLLCKGRVCCLHRILKINLNEANSVLVKHVCKHGSQSLVIHFAAHEVVIEEPTNTDASTKNGSLQLFKSGR